MFIHYILHKLESIFPVVCVFIFISMVQRVSATEVLNIQIDPPSPIFNQPFKCTLTLNQDDHRNACDLIPSDAPADMKPWDICRINNISADARTRYYDCFVTDQQKNFVPSPGNYQIVVWNFTGDGETGKITARKDITILAQPPPSSTPQPKPTPTTYIPPPQINIPTVVQNIPITIPTTIPTKRPNPTVIYFSFPQSDEPPQIPSPIPTNPSLPSTNFSFPQIKITLPDLTKIYSSISVIINNSSVKLQASLLSPFMQILSNFLSETNF